MKLKGHRPACKCVGCSAATRARGMKALGLHPNKARVSKGAKTPGARIVGKSRKSRRKQIRRAQAAFERIDRATGSKISKLADRKSFPNPRRRRNPARRVVRHGNPAGNLIGTSAVLHVGARAYRAGGRLMTGPGPHRFTITGARSLRLDGKRIRAVDYRHDAKALRAYGRVAPFRHKFTRPAWIQSSGGGRIVVESRSPLWEKQ